VLIGVSLGRPAILGGSGAKTVDEARKDGKGISRGHHTPISTRHAATRRLALTRQSRFRVFSFLMYPILFFSFYAMFRQVPLGAAIALGLIWLR
jgi:hypothetical protein